MVQQGAMVDMFEEACGGRTSSRWIGGLGEIVDVSREMPGLSPLCCHWYLPLLSLFVFVVIHLPQSWFAGLKCGTLLRIIYPVSKSPDWRSPPPMLKPRVTSTSTILHLVSEVSVTFQMAFI